MAKIKTSAVFIDLNGNFFIGVIVADSNKNGELLFPLSFSGTDGISWTYYKMTEKTKRPVFKQVLKLIEQENVVKDKIDDKEYIKQLEAFCDNQEDLIKKQQIAIARLNKYVETQNKKLETLTNSE